MFFSTFLIDHIKEQVKTKRGFHMPLPHTIEAGYYVNYMKKTKTNSKPVSFTREDVEIIDGQFEVSYTIHVDAPKIFELGQVVNGKLSTDLHLNFTKSQLLNLHHDFPLRHWLGTETDVKVRDIFDVLINDGGNDKTPDYFFKFEHEGRTKLIIIEVSTNQAHDLKPIESDFTKKKNTYEGILKSRYDNQQELQPNLDVFYYIISIGRKGISTNLPGGLGLIRDIATILTNRYKLMLKFDNFIIESEGISLMYNRQKRQEHHQFEVLLRDLSLNYEDKYFTEEFWNFCHSGVDENSIKDLLKRKVFNTMSQDERYCRSRDLYLERLNEKLGVNSASGSTSGVSRKSSTISLDDHVNYSEEYTSFIKKVRKTKTRFDDNKKVIIFPLCFPEVSQQPTISLSKIASYLVSNDPKHYMEYYWASALAEGMSLRDKFDMNEDLLFELAKENREPDETGETVGAKRKKVALTLNLSYDVKVSAAMVGVESKASKLEHVGIVQEKRRMDKIVLDPDTLTDDISEFISNSGLLEQVADIFIPSRIVNSQLDNPDITKIVRNLARFYNGTKMASWLRFISSIAAEIATSARTNLNLGQFTLKKLKDYECLLMMKTTNQKEHCFFSLCFKKEECMNFSKGSIGPELIESGNCLLTPWRSIKPSKVGHYVKSDSMGHSVFTNYLDLFDVSYRDASNPEGSSWIHKHPLIEQKIAADLLIFLECKPATEEVITLTRYAGMESLTAPTYTPFSTKVIRKFSTAIRTRLQLFMMKRLADWSSKLPTVRYRPQWDKETMTFVNLFDMITGKPIPDLNCFIHMFYEGYLCSKELGAEKNSSFKLIEKILKYEILHRKLIAVNPKYHMSEPNGTPKEHEFSPNFVKMLADFQVKEWKTQDENLAELESELLDTMTKIKWSDVLTLKAAAKYKEQVLCDINKKAFEEHCNKNKHSRPTVLEAVFQMRKEMNLPKTATLFDHSLQALKELNTKGGIAVDLFKKPQHGGLREIYVLEIRARMVQIYLERIARHLCSKFNSEIMSHPKNKYLIPQNMLHRNKTAHKTVTLSYAADASKWNQVHFVPKFALFMIRITPKLFHKFIWNAMQLWVNKHIEIPADLVNFFLDNPFSESSNDIYSGLRSDFLGFSQELKGSARAGQLHVTIESGMMQGILHFTSSLMHTVFQEWLKLRFSLIFQKRGVLVKIENQQSSDDSSLIFGWVFQDENFPPDKVKDVITLMESLFYYKDALGKYIGILPSIEKSTPCLLNSVEFNSEYFFGANWIRPTNRWVYAALTCDMVETFCDRFENFSNLVTQCLEGGASATLCSSIQVAQATLHYIIMGETLTNISVKCLKEAIRQEDPSVGFMPLTPSCVCGLLGFNFDLFTLCKRSNIFSSNIAQWLKDTVNDSCTEIKIGPLNKRFKIQMSNKAKFRALLKRMQVELDWRDLFRQEPELFFRDALTSTEVTAITMYKLFSPGVVASLSNHDSIFRTMAAGIYMYTRSVVQEGNNWSDLDSLPKMTLANVIFKRSNPGVSLTVEQLIQLFPNYYEYDQASCEVMKFRQFQGADQKLRVKMRSRVEIIPQNQIHLFPLMRILRSHWFGHALPISKDHFKQVISNLRLRYKWITSSFQESLKKFDPEHNDPITFYSFISQVDYSKSRSVFLINSSAAKNENVNLHSIVTRFQWKNTKFELPRNTSTIVNTDSLTLSSSSLRHHLFCVTKMPFTNLVLIKELQMIFDNYKDKIGKECFVGDSTNTVNIMLKFASGMYQNQMVTFTNEISSSKKGIYGMFTLRQNYNNATKKYAGIGVWTGMISSTVIKILIEDENACAVVLSRLTDISEINQLLPDLCKELQITGFTSQESVELRKHINQTDDRTFWSVTHRGITSEQSTGCYIYVNNNMVTTYISPSSCYLQSDGEFLRLKQSKPKGESDLTVLNYRIKARDYQPDTNYFLGSKQNRPPFYWAFVTGNESEKKSEALRIIVNSIRVCDGDMTPQGFDFRKLKAFLTDLLRNELVIRGYVDEIGSLLATNFRKVEDATNDLEQSIMDQSTTASNRLTGMSYHDIDAWEVDDLNLGDDDMTDLEWAQNQIACDAHETVDQLEEIWSSMLHENSMNQNDLFKLTQNDVKIRESVFTGCKILRASLGPILAATTPADWQMIFLRAEYPTHMDDFIDLIKEILPFKINRAQEDYIQDPLEELQHL